MLGRIIDSDALGGWLKIHKEEQEIRQKMARGIIGTAGFQGQMDKRAIEIKRPSRGRPGK